MWKVGLGAVLVASLSLLAWTSASALGRTSGDEPDRITVRGTLKLTGGAFSATGTECSATGGYTDIAAGAPVVIHDDTGKVIATGILRAGRSSDFFEDAGKQIPATCQFSFVVFNVPSGPFYGVQVSHRGTVTFSAAQVASEAVTLTLGA